MLSFYLPRCDQLEAYVINYVGCLQFSDVIMVQVIAYNVGNFEAISDKFNIIRLMWSPYA